jgi:hypothetical protein
MSVLSWLRLAVTLWLLRRAARLAGWLLLAAAAVAAWPVTAVTAVGYTAAWLRGWPAVRLRRTAAEALLVTGVWLFAAALHASGWRTLALIPVRDWQAGWQWHVTAPGLTRTFLLLAPPALPAGLGLAALAWAWRIYAVTAGIRGWTASAPITFDARQWRRQVRTAGGRIAAPGAVPLLARRSRIPVGGTIRTVGHRWRPVFAVPAAACARHMVVVGATGSGKTNLMMRSPAAAGRTGLQGRPGRQDQGRPHPPPAVRRGRSPRRDLARRGPAVPVGPAAQGPGRTAVPDDRQR